MSARDFENKVQEQMGEFKIPPSEALWQKVDQQLRQDRKRRRIIIWLPLLLLLGTGSYWWFANSSHKEEPTNKISVVTTDIPSSSNKNQPSAQTTNETSSTPDAKPVKAGTKNNENKKAETKSGFSAPSNLKAVTETSDNSKSSSNTDRVTKNKTAPVIAKNTTQEVIAGPTNKKETSLPNSNRSTKNQRTNSNERVKVTGNASAITDLVTQKQAASENEWKASSLNPVIWDRSLLNNFWNLPSHLDTPLTTLHPVEVKEAVAKVKPQATRDSKGKKWSWGLSGSMGNSGISDQSLFNGLASARVADAYLANTASSQGPATYVPSSSIRTALGNSFGVFTLKEVGKRTAISIGLNYSNFSTRSSVGVQVDSQKTINNASSNVLVVADFYRAGTADKYTNRYHFISMPVNWNLALVERKNFKWSWQAGFTLSQLIATNALHYDSNLGVYYKDNSLFRKTQLGWQTGFVFGFNEKSRHPIEWIPLFQYNSSSLLKTPGTQKSHLWYAGFQIRYFLKK